MSKYHRNGKDFYSVLRISQSASVQEIKSSYRKLAMELHPDKHKGCPNKLEQFKEINEAYAILADIAKRREYDVDIGISRRKRSSPLPKDYRKVYAPRPPPDWKFTWDHAKHYEMHYGDGFKKEAIKEARLKAERDGLFEYRSPLGRGFSFSSEPDRSPDEYTNPYSKTPQGPPKVVFEYEEGEISDPTRGKTNMTAREKIVVDLYARRSARRTQEQQETNQQQRFHGTYQHPRVPAAEENDCVIL